MTSFHSRSRPARGVISSWDRPTLVFLTACTRNRRPWLAQTRPHAILLKVWLESQSLRTHAEPSALVRRPSSGPMDFDRWVTAWKTEFSRIAKNRALRWQARCFHHRIRSWESAEAKYRCVLNNPVRHGLVSSAEEWPYQGELFPMKDRW